MRTLVKYIVERLLGTDRPLCIFGILPTGYGKTSIIVSNPVMLSKLGRFIHVLPLRAIIEKHSKKAVQGLGGENVGYQAHLYLDDVYKTPFLSRRYVVTTFDSFFLNFYGIPVAEMLRPRWHSDLAIIMSSSANLILDEVHMVLNPDAAEDRDVEAFSKVLSVTLDAITRALRLGYHVLVLSATMSPMLVKVVVRNVLEELQRTSTEASVEVVVYGDRGHDYVKELGKELQGKNVELYVDRDQGFDELFQDVSYEVRIDKNIEGVHDLATEALELSKRFDRVAVFVNTVATAYEVWRKILEMKPDADVLILHSRLTPRSRARVIEALGGRDRYIVVATQSIEAGVDISFQAAISAPCSPLSAVQRVGRVCRYGKEDRSECVFVFASRFLDGVCTVYDEHEVRLLIEFLSRNIDSLGQGASWRVPGIGRVDVLNLVAEVDKIVQGYVGVLGTASTHIRSKLNKMMYTRDPKQVIELYDEFFHGSFVRSTPILNLVFVDDTWIKVEDCVEVSADYIKSIKLELSVATGLDVVKRCHRRGDLVKSCGNSKVVMLGVALGRLRGTGALLCATCVDIERLMKRPITQLLNARRMLQDLASNAILREKGLSTTEAEGDEYVVNEVEVLGVAARLGSLTKINDMAMYV